MSLDRNKEVPGNINDVNIDGLRDSGYEKVEKNPYQHLSPMELVAALEKNSREINQVVLAHLNSPAGQERVAKNHADPEDATQKIKDIMIG